MNAGSPQGRLCGVKQEFLSRLRWYLRMGGDTESSGEARAGPRCRGRGADWRKEGQGAEGRACVKVRKAM